MALSLHPNLATIAPNLPFLDSLASWWLARAGAGPLATAEGIFVVPTRRAARGLADAFLRQAGGRPLLTPRILTLGGMDEAPLAMAGALQLPPAVSPPLRLAVLARFILAMGGRNGAPTDADRAWTLAAELARLLDEAARAEIDLAAALPRAVGEDFAAHWNVTLKFLEVVTKAWPDWLAEQGFSDIAARQSALLDAQTEAWRAVPPELPVIAAGTTGAIPAVARLLKLVAHLPQGMVVLPGLDLDLDEASFAALEEGHPQASLRHLLASLDARRGDVRHFAEREDRTENPVCPAERVKTWGFALLPAPSMHAWQDAVLAEDSGMERLEPADQQEEALAIALALRGALEQPGHRAALVTPDRALARRVSAELLRFGIVADDSAGEDLLETPQAVFLRLLAEAVAEDLRPVPLLALLKHPFCAAGLSPAACREAARRLERAVLRGPSPPPGIAGLRRGDAPAAFLDRLELALAPLMEKKPYPHPQGRGLEGRGLVEGSQGGQKTPPDALLIALLRSAELLAATDTDAGSTVLWAGEEGEVLARHLGDLIAALKILPSQDFSILPGLLESTLAGGVVRSRRALRGREGMEHPRVYIWGLLEARLQAVDLIVLGGLCEGVWPAVAESGPWMNRTMRSAVGLPSPEEQVGLAAHDFVMASCAAPRAILSAPRRRDGAPAVPSRWLVRLDALLAGKDLALPRHPACGWARAIDRPLGSPLAVKPPAPVPPVAQRPRKLSVTEIETFLSDPYAIYAKHILRLKKLDPLEQSADAADYGSIAHEGLSRFFVRNGAAWPATAAAQLQADMDSALADAGMRPALAAWWRPRLHRIAAWVADAESDRRKRGRPLLLSPEIKGSWWFEAPAGRFLLHGRADRIERRADGTIAILDYKTGTPPTTRQVEEGRAPQLPLEAAMAREGGFGAEFAEDVGELTYWHISGGHEPGKVLPLFKGDPDRTAEMAVQAGASLQKLIAEFDDAARAYLSQPSPGAAPRFSDYAQLARVAEWAAVEEE